MSKIYEFEAEIKKVPEIDGEDIRAKIGKQPGDRVKVTLKERTSDS